MKIKYTKIKYLFPSFKVAELAIGIVSLLFFLYLHPVLVIYLPGAVHCRKFSPPWWEPLGKHDFLGYTAPEKSMWIPWSVTASIKWGFHDWNCCHPNSPGKENVLITSKAPILTGCGSSRMNLWSNEALQFRGYELHAAWLNLTVTLHMERKIACKVVVKLTVLCFL